MDIDLGPFLLLLALPPIFYMSTFCHEVGHAVMGWLCGFEVTSFGMGLGRPFWVGRWGGARVYFCWTKPFQGITFSFAPRIYPTRWQAAGMLSGGILVNLLLTVVFATLSQVLPWGDWLCLLIAATNGIMVVANSVPFVMSLGQVTLRSDGAQILQVLFQRGAPLLPPVRIQMIRAMRGLWEAIGDTKGLWVYSLDSALAWRELGDVERCRERVAEADALVKEGSPGQRGFAALVRGAVLVAAKEPEAAAVALAQAGETFQTLGNANGLFLVRWTRADRLLQAGDFNAADAELIALQTDPVVARQPALKVSLLVSRLGPAAARGDHEAFQGLVQDYMAMRGRYPSLARDMQLFVVVARYHMAREELALASVHFLNALAVASVMCRAFSDADDLAHFKKCHERLLTDARECLIKIGQTERAAKLDEYFVTLEQVKQEQEALRRKIDRRRWRLGMKLALAELFGCGLAVLVIALRLFGHREPEEWVIRLLAGIGACLVVVMIFAVGSLTVGGFTALFDWWRKIPIRGGGTIVLMLAAMPWLSVIAFLVFLLSSLNP